MIKYIIERKKEKPWIKFNKINLDLSKLYLRIIWQKLIITKENIFSTVKIIIFMSDSEIKHWLNPELEERVVKL